MKKWEKLYKRILCGILSGILFVSGTLYAPEFLSFTNMSVFLDIDSPGMIYAAANDDSLQQTMMDFDEKKLRDEMVSEESYVSDTPIRLQVSKVKTAVSEHEGLNPKSSSCVRSDTITYKVSGRVEGDLANLIGIYGEDNIEPAYNSAGNYLGYAWLTGTREYLLQRKEQALDEDVELLYNSFGVFEGYAYITRKLETADDRNRYIAGAKMSLYDAIEIVRDLSSEPDKDDKFVGVTVLRDDGTSNVKSVYVNKGYAGTKTEYVLQKRDDAKIVVDDYGTTVDNNYDYKDSIDDAGNGVWAAETIQRADTPILYYSLDDLHITTNDCYTSVDIVNAYKVDQFFGSSRYQKASDLYGFDKNGNVVNAEQSDERDFSIFAFRDGDSRPVFEFAGGDYHHIRYSKTEKLIRFEDAHGNQDTELKMYHLDSDGNRDSLVDPTTGIAYITETLTLKEHGNAATGKELHERIYVWPVNIFYDGSGNGEGNSSGSKYFQKIKTSRIATIHADTKDEYSFGNLNESGSAFVHSMNPVLDSYGHPVYYRKSADHYQKGIDLYDSDGVEYLGYLYDDGLDNWNENAYIINQHKSLYNGDKDDPFDQTTHYQYSEKQSIRLIVDLDGNYVIDGADNTPIPERKGYTFAGWMVDPKNLTDGKVLNAAWNSLGNPMSDSQKQKWYSRNTAAGTTKTVTVTFYANGGYFNSGAGAIHSTDNKLYRRQGNAYLIENTWITGENTPNDPFDETCLDSIKNKAEGSFVLTKGNKTGNDVYSNETSSGGMADMLKRVGVGTYIMEEADAPLGFMKGLPVGVTINHTAEVQKAEMADQTIKVELFKINAPAEGYNLCLEKDGVLMRDAADQMLQVQAQKGDYTFSHVKDAVLSLHGADEKTKKAFGDWIQITSDMDFSKQKDGEEYYINFQSDKPLFLEGIPKGEYLVYEINTPDGYVTMSPQTFSVTGKEAVQMIPLKDDHIRVAFDKYYYTDTYTKSGLPNRHQAELTLKDAADHEVMRWNTDDISDYTSAENLADSVWNHIKAFFSGMPLKNESFVSRFGALTDEYGPGGFDNINWIIERKAFLESDSSKEKETWICSDGKRYTVSFGVVENSAPESFRLAYAERTKEQKSISYEEHLSAVLDQDSQKTNVFPLVQIWKISNGSVIRVTLKPTAQKTITGRQEYVVNFQFNYKDNFTGIYKNLVSYDTRDGLHHMDYLPEGDYKLCETRVPDGFAKPEDKDIVVKETNHLQIFTFENKKRELKILKYGMESNNTYFGGLDVDGQTVLSALDLDKAAVMKGADFQLYRSSSRITDPDRAFANGVVPAEAILVDSFRSGEDGIYSEEDHQKEIIAAWQVGDYRYHQTKDLINGWYYLVETKAPDYMDRASVQELQVTDESMIEDLKLRMINHELPLEIKVRKVNMMDSPLQDAVFEVKNRTLGITIGTLVTDAEGNACLTINDAGTFNRSGVFVPYEFSIREIQAPAGYATEESIHIVHASRNLNHVGSALKMENSEDVLTDFSINDGVLTVKDEITEIDLYKIDFDQNMVVPGTELIVYEAEAKDNIWKSKGVTKPEWSWTVASEEKKHTLIGLSAGKTYVVKEISAPKGYTLSRDLFFTVSANGKSIEKFWYDEGESSYIAFSENIKGAVESISMPTRMITAVTAEVKELSSGIVFQKGVQTDGTITFALSEVKDGENYSISQKILFSDGSIENIGTYVFQMKIAEAWGETISVSVPFVKNTCITVQDEEGKLLYTLEPNGNEITIANPVKQEEDSFTVIPALGCVGTDHAAVLPEEKIRYQFRWNGVGKKIKLIPDPNIEILASDPELTLESDGTYHYITTRESGTIQISAIVKEKASGFIRQMITSDGYVYSYMNPISANRRTGIFADTTTLVIFNEATGTDPNIDTDVFTYKVTLTQKDGKPLSGSYDYRTKKHHGEFFAFDTDTYFVETLTGDDFLVISDLPEGTKYSVTEIVPVGFEYAVTNTIPCGTTDLQAVSNVLFTNEKNMESERLLFKKNHGYIISEDVTLLNDYIVRLKSFGFVLDEIAHIKGIHVRNRKTNVQIKKVSSEGTPIAGSLLSVKDGSAEIERWVTENEARKLSGVFLPGHTYTLSELKSADGYAYADDISFTVSDKGSTDYIIMKDEKTKIRIIKKNKNDEFISGAVLAVILQTPDENGNIEESIVYEFISDDSWKDVTGVLHADESYLLREMKAPYGYCYSEDVPFSVLHDDSMVVVNMIDRELKVELSKEDFAGHELAGAECELFEKQQDGSWKKIDSWISKADVSHILSEEICAEKIYRFHEEAAPEGYGYSQDIEFSISKDGTVIGAHYVNKDGIPILQDSNGYPTSIEMIANEDGGYRYSDNGVSITIDENGDAIDEGGRIRARGVSYDIAVQGNKVIMKDAPTKMKLIKKDHHGNEVAGSVFQIFEELSGAAGSPVKAFSDTTIPSIEHDGNIRKGENLIITVPLDGIIITKLLDAGKSYVLKEVNPPPGHHIGKDIFFSVPYYNQNEPIVVTAENEANYITFSKRDFAGRELKGAECDLLKVKKDGTKEILESWVSSAESDYVIEGQLNCGEIYRFHEKAAPEGYGCSQDIEFHIGQDGTLKDVHYVNENGKPILYDEEGYPTTVVITNQGDGTFAYSDNGKSVMIDADGNAVDTKGQILASKVGYLIQTDGNKIVVKDAPTKVKLTKKSKSGEALKGGVFEICKPDHTIVTAIEDTDIPSTEHEGTIKKGENLIFCAEESGIVFTGVLHAGEKYMLCERTAPGGYLKTSEVIFQVPYYNTKRPLEVVMEDSAIKAVFSKQELNGEKIIGATCIIEQICSDGTLEVIDTWKTDMNDHVIEGILEQGKNYRFTEKSAPAGYTYSETIEFTISEDGTIGSFHYVDSDGDIVLQDRDGFPTSIKVIQQEDGSVHYSDNGSMIMIDDHGNAVDENGIVHAEQISTEMAVADNKVIMKDARTDILLVKKNEDGEFLSGGVYTIKKGDTPVKANCDTEIPSLEHEGNIRIGEILKFAMKKEGIRIAGQLEAGARYSIYELLPPKGYAYNQNMEFVIPFYNQKEPICVTMIDKKTHVVISKTDVTGENEIPGNLLQVRDMKGNILEEWISGTSPHEIIAVLEAGKSYSLTEVKPAAGWSYAETIPFTVSADGSIDRVRMKNVPTDVVIHKVDTQGTAISGAQLQLIDKNGNVIADWTSSDKAYELQKMLISGETYTLHEVKAPTGYLQGADQKFVVPLNGDTLDFKLVNYRLNGGGGESGNDKTNYQKPEITITKKGITYGERIPEAAVHVWNDKDYDVIAVTNEYGEIDIHPTSPGIYHFRELEAPEGYRLNDNTYEFYVEENGSVWGDRILFEYQKPEKDHIGRVYAFYKSNLEGNEHRSAYPWTGKTHTALYQTGESIMSDLRNLAEGIFMILVLILGYHLHRKKRSCDV